MTKRSLYLNLPGRRRRPAEDRCESGASTGMSAIGRHTQLAEFWIRDLLFRTHAAVLAHRHALKVAYPVRIHVERAMSVFPARRDAGPGPCRFPGSANETLSQVEFVSVGCALKNDSIER